MSTEKMRESFELHIRKGIWGESATTEKCRCLSRDSDGPYENMAVQRDWELWQASRAAIEVELPRQHGVHYPRMFSDEVRTAIESLGLKVKP